MNSTLADYEIISLYKTPPFRYFIEAYDYISDKRVLIKRAYKENTKLSREYEILSEIKNCDYILKLLNTFYSINNEGKLIENLVFEFANRSLEQYMDDFRKTNKFVQIEKIKNISKQILLGLDFCHKKNIVHRNLKPENVLFTEDEAIKIYDFENAKIIKDNSGSTPIIATRYYRAPELILGKCDYNEKVDIFAAGCIIAELFILRPLFPGKTDGFQILEQISILGNPGKEYFEKFNLPRDIIEYYSKIKIEEYPNFDNILNGKKFYSNEDIKEATDLIKNMIKWDYNKRYSAELCLNHSFLK